MSVTAIIVTYNRRKELFRCIDTVLNQTVQPDYLLIVNNASTDDTENCIYLKFGVFVNAFAFEQDIVLKSQDYNRMPIYLVNKSFNTGGAGGFYTGLKIAHQYLATDFYWMMDDDGYPSKECLERQLAYTKKCDYIMPVSIDLKNHAHLSWNTRKKNKKKTIQYEELKNSWGEVMPFVFPFNGSLLSYKLVTQVGYIKPELFIWGDDYEHYYRCLVAGYSPITLLNAIFYHPANKIDTYPIMKGLFHVPYTTSNLRLVCLARNWTYIYKKNHLYFHIVRNFLAYSWLFMVTLRDIAAYKLYLVSLYDGLVENWERHKNFL